MTDKKSNLKYEIINQIGVVYENPSGWKMEVNRVSWNGKEPKYDIRMWSSDHLKMGKGITLSEDALISLSDILNKEVEFLKEE